MLKTIQCLARRLFSKGQIDLYWKQKRWVNRKLEKSEVYKNKLKYLRGIANGPELAPYFQTLKVSMIDNSDAFFFIQNQDLFSSQPFAVRKDLIIKSQITNLLLHFLLTKMMECMNERVIQQFLLKKFNENVHRLDADVIAFCLREIKEFKLGDSELDLLALEKALFQVYNPGSLVEISVHLLDMQINFPNIMTEENFQRWFLEIEKDFSLSFKLIYYIRRLGEQFNISLAPTLLVRMDESMLQALRHLNMLEFEPEYLIFLLKYYPKYASSISLAGFTPLSYQRYLEYLLQHKNNQIRAIKVPDNVIRLSSKTKFKRIIDLRVALSLTNELNLSISLRSYFSKSLSCVQATLSYLHDCNSDDPEVWFHVENAIIEKLRMNHKFDLRIYTNYQFQEVLEVISFMAKFKRGSIKFRKLTTQFVAETLQHEQIFFSIDESRRENCCSHLFAVSAGNNIYSQLLQKAIKLTIATLQNHAWQDRKICRLIRSLNKFQVQDDKVWYLVEKQLINALKTGDPVKQKRLREEELPNVIKCFSQRKKGSFELWTYARNNLNLKNISNPTAERANLEVIFYEDEIG